MVSGIVDYMIEQSGPPSKEIQSLKQVQEFLKDGDDVIIIGVFQGDNDPAYQQYQDAGECWPCGWHWKRLPGICGRWLCTWGWGRVRGW